MSDSSHENIFEHTIRIIKGEPRTFLAPHSGDGSGFSTDIPIGVNMNQHQMQTQPGMSWQMQNHRLQNQGQSMQWAGHPQMQPQVRQQPLPEPGYGSNNQRRIPQSTPAQNGYGSSTPGPEMSQGQSVGYNQAQSFASGYLNSLQAGQMPGQISGPVPIQGFGQSWQHGVYGAQGLGAAQPGNLQSGNLQSGNLQPNFGTGYGYGYQ